MDFTFTAQEVQLILDCLGEAPGKFTWQAIALIKQKDQELRQKAQEETPIKED